ncbi:hypothetical protein H9L39_16892 [Fusarium oxysporum f. sp. albedinis]|nr:hypothetical protein H9L39_16892 [Fusarium oxysporum f. sp. albedinis]
MLNSQNLDWSQLVEISSMVWRPQRRCGSSFNHFFGSVADSMGMILKHNAISDIEGCCNLFDLSELFYDDPN